MEEKKAFQFDGRVNLFELGHFPKTNPNNRGWVTKDGGRDEETAGVSALIAD